MIIGLRNQKTVIIACATFVAVAITIGVRALIRESQDLDAKIRSKSAVLSRYHRLLEQKEILQAALQNIQQTQLRGNGVLLELERLAGRDIIKINDIRPENGYGKNMRVSIRTSGTLAAYLRFLYHLNHAGIRLSVRRCQLSAGTKDGDVAGNLIIDLSSF